MRIDYELLDKRRFRNQAGAKMAVFDFIERWRNPRRRHSSLDYVSPASYEKRNREAAEVAKLRTFRESGPTPVRS